MRDSAVDFPAVPAGTCLGIGVDIEAVDRWRDPDPRLFTEEEHAYCLSRADPAEAYAGTWCAKESVVKAVMPSAPILTRQVHIRRDEAGAPYAAIPTELPILALVSISHSAGLAVAVAIVIRVGVN